MKKLIIIIFIFISIKVFGQVTPIADFSLYIPLTATVFNKVTITAPSSASTLTIPNGATLQTTGAFTLNLTATANSTPTFPTGSGTLLYNNGSAASLTGLPLTTGVTGMLPIANGGTGISTTPTNGQIFIGSTASGLYTAATITGTTSQITVTNGSGSITLSTPQAIATNSNPQFLTIGLGTTASASTHAILLGGATGISQMRWNTGVAPTSPVSGDWWRLSSNQVQFYDGTNTNNVVFSQNSQVIIYASTQTTLVAGTKALSITGVTTGSHAYVNSVSQSGTVSTTFEYAAVCTSGTVTITALTTGNVANTLDTSTINVMVTN